MGEQVGGCEIQASYLSLHTYGCTACRLVLTWCGGCPAVSLNFLPFLLHTLSFLSDYLSPQSKILLSNDQRDTIN